MSPWHPEPSPLGTQPPVAPSGSRYIRSREMLPLLAASVTNRLPSESTASPVGAVRLASLGVLGQLFAPKPPLQVPNTRCAVWLVNGESYSNTASRSEEH